MEPETTVKTQRIGKPAGLHAMRLLRPKKAAKPKVSDPRRAENYRFSMRNERRRTVGFGALPWTQKAVARAGKLSREYTLKALQTEMKVKAMRAAGKLPSILTPEGQAIRALLAQFDPRVGPGKPNIHTTHRRIAKHDLSMAQIEKARKAKGLPKYLHA
jgi:hypothetical protein